MALGASVDITQLRTDFDATRATVDADKRIGRKIQTRYIRRDTLAAATALSLRTFAWTQTDDQELLVAWLRVTDAAGGPVVTLTLAVDGADAEPSLSRFLVDTTVSLSVTSIAGTVDSRPTSLDMRPVTGMRVRLKQGVRYRMTLSSTGNVGVVVACIGLLGMRRKR